MVQFLRKIRLASISGFVLIGGIFKNKQSINILCYKIILLDVIIIVGNFLYLIYLFLAKRFLKENPIY